MVEYQKIEDVCQNIFAGGTPNTKREDYYDGNIPWIRSGEVDFNVITEAERNISELGYKNSSAKLIRKGSVVMAMTGATVAKSAIVEFETSANQSVCALETNEDIITYRFLYYLLSKNYFTIKSSAQGALTSLNLSMIKQIVIPVPSLKIQKEIVRVLDSFTQLQSNLEAELVSRQKQYEFYRNKLLAFDENDEGVEWKTLGEVAAYSKERIHASLLNETNYVSVENLLQNKAGKINSSCCPADGNWIRYRVGDVLIGNIRPYLRKIWLADIDGGTNGDVLTIHIDNTYKETLNSKYLYYILSSEDFFLYDIQNSKGAKMPRGDKDSVLKYPIPIPSFARQCEIVSILDTFESLTTNLKKEIEARKKQYEYYREQLLTFE